MLQTQEASKLTALVQQQAQSRDEDGDEYTGAPAAAGYETHSTSILDVLEDLKDKAQEQLASLRGQEAASTRNFQLLEQSLQDSLKYDGEGLTEAKATRTSCAASQAAAQKSLAGNTAELSSDEAAQAQLGADCTMRASMHEEEARSRAEELKAIQEAKAVIVSTTGGGAQASYGFGQVSLLQTGLRTAADLRHLEALRFLRELARKQPDPALQQLSARISTAVATSARAGQDPFVKVRGLITDLIKRLEASAAAEASHKAYCDKELGAAAAKRAKKQAEADKLSARIGQAEAQVAADEEAVATLQGELAALAQSQLDMDAQRKDEKALFAKVSADLEQGIEGVRSALRILRGYYGEEAAHAQAEGSGSSIIGLLEVIESDFSKDLAELRAAEGTAAQQHEAQTKTNEVTKARKESDVAGRAREIAGLKRYLGEARGDLGSVQSELAAVSDYDKQLDKMCSDVPETYAERKSRREAELAGLREALSILEGASLLQTGGFLSRVCAH